jgi:glycosyltransferase involved in cell wall biosynthesis
MPVPDSPINNRARQAFILGWPLAQLGGVTEVVRCLVREFQQSGSLAPLVLEATNAPLSEGLLPEVPVLRLLLPTPCNPQHPFRSLLAFLFRLPSLFLHLQRLCREHQITVLNPHFVGLEHLGLMLFRRSGLFQGKLVLSFHGSDIRSMLQTKGWRRFLARTLLRGADVLVPCSIALGEEILLLVPERACALVPIQNGIDSESFAKSAAIGIELPDSFGRRRKLLNIGAFEYKKGHDVLLRAFAQVLRECDDVCLIIAGQTSEALVSTQRLIDELKIGDHVLLMRDMPHAKVAALLRASDIFVFSSRWEKGICGEGFAMALLEAAALSKPVVSTCSCGVAELLTNGQTGLIVPTERPDLLAEAVEKLLIDPVDAARQAANLHELVKREFTWTVAHAGYLRVAAGPLSQNASRAGGSENPVPADTASCP